MIHSLSFYDRLDQNLIVYWDRSLFPPNHKFTAIHFPQDLIFDDWKESVDSAKSVDTANQKNKGRIQAR